MNVTSNWIPGGEEVEDACTLLNEKMYKRLAKKCLKESTERVYKSGETYYCQDLYRDSHVKQLPCFVMNEKMKRALPYYEYIKLGEFIFKVFKVFVRDQRVQYKLITGPQLNLFEQ